MSGLAPIDIRLSNAVLFEFKLGNFDRKMEFQFPPRMITDGRTASWSETELPGDEPVAVYETSSGRNMRLEWTYIVGVMGDKEWDTRRISNQVRALRRYFSKEAEGEGVDNELIIFFKMWKHGGDGKFTCRMKEVSVTHGKTIVVPDGRIEDAYPLRTDIAVSLNLWTKGGSTIRTDITTLIPAVTFDWF